MGAVGEVSFANRLSFKCRGKRNNVCIFKVFFAVFRLLNTIGYVHFSM